MSYDTRAMELTSGERERVLTGIILQLLAVNAALQARLERLEQRTAELEAGAGKPKGMPGNKLEPKQPKQPKTERKQRECNFSRKRSQPTVLEPVVHALDTCPDCGGTLTHGTIKRSREVIEVVTVPAMVTEHVYIERCCPVCNKCYTPKPELEGVVVGKGRLGVGLLCLIASLREVGRLPIRTIQWYLETMHGLHLSVGAINNALKTVARAGEGQMQQLKEQVRGSPAVNVDETGWRQDGQNGYVWTFATADVRLFVRRNRSGQVVEEVLGTEYEGVLCSDFYAGYNVHLGQHQRCWAHLLRDIHDLAQLHPDDEALRMWADEVHKLYERATKWVQEWPDVSEQTRRQARLWLEEQLLVLCKPYLQDQAALQGKLCRRIERHLKELFVFVAVPGVDPDNNAAERSLRPLVTARKISGGTRSEEGTDTKMTLASLFGTWKARGQDLLAECRRLLSPDPSPESTQV
jgi:transposase